MEHACKKKKKNHINHVPPPLHSSSLCNDKSTLTNKAYSASSAPLVTDLSLSSHQHNNATIPASKVEPFSNKNNNQIHQNMMAVADDSLFCLDHQRKRMMKNRESAARSRARKQAYTIELQQKVKQLLEENARLKIQHQQLCEIEAIQQKRKHNLFRTSTAPF